jgi:hypothetical protein
MNRGNKRWRCAEPDAKGAQCGLTTQVWYDGRPMCRVHRQKALGEAIPGTFKKRGQVIPKRDPLEVLEETLPFVRDTNEKIRLSEAILAERRKREAGCPTCRVRAEDERFRTEENEYVIRRLTADQKAELGRLHCAVWRIVDAAKAQPIAPEGRATPGAITLATGEVIFVDPERTVYQPPEPESSAADTAGASVDARSGSQEEGKARSVPCSLDPERYKAVGLFVENGVVTHALGDEHAQAILEGRITFEEARAQQLALEQTLNRMPIN